VGVGIQSNLLNFGLGPTVEYFPVGNFSLAGSIGALSDFTSYGIRGNYFFKKTENYRPYLGAGYSHINGPEATPVPGSKLETKGSGLEIYGGLLQLVSKNLGIRYEIIYSTITLKISESGSSYSSESVPVDYGSFSIGLAITYFF
jgi:outer membrane protein W